MHEIPLIKTSRLALCPATESDTPRLHALWVEPSVRQYLWDDEVISVERAAEVVNSSVKLGSEEGLGLWCVSERPGSAMVGFVALRRPERSREVELLYGFLPQYWGRGYATEASAAAVDYTFSTSGVPRVCAGADVPNTKSFAVMKRVGMGEQSDDALSNEQTRYLFVTRAQWHIQPDYVTVRRAQPDDAAELQRLYQSFDDTGHALPSNQYVAQWLQHCESEVVFVAQSSSQLVGFAALQVLQSFVSEHGTAELAELFVQEEHRRRGIGSLLLEQTRRYCARAQVSEMILRVNRRNKTAIRCYQGAGWQRADHEVYRLYPTNTRTEETDA